MADPWRDLAARCALRHDRSSRPMRA